MAETRNHTSSCKEIATYKVMKRVLFGHDTLRHIHSFVGLQSDAPLRMVNVRIHHVLQAVPVMGLRDIKDGKKAYCTSLALLKWAVEEINMPLDKWTCAAAAYVGNLDVTMLL